MVIDSVWHVTQTILHDNRSKEEGDEAYYLTKEAAIRAVLDYLAIDYEDGVQNHVFITADDKNDPNSNFTISTFDSDRYGLYECEFYFEKLPLDREFGA